MGADTEPGRGTTLVAGQVLETAMEAAARVSVEPTSQIPFQSQGRVLVIGECTDALALIDLALIDKVQSADLVFCVLVPGPVENTSGVTVPVLFAGGREIRIEGHFGAFSVKLGDGGGEVDLTAVLDREQRKFDLLVDLWEPPRLSYPVLPLGYYAPGPDPEARRQVLAELPEMVGEFSKPKFFQYDPEICAHGNSGLRGCTRCLDTCPTGAITSLAERIQIDPFYCQGGGSCATACPTGAIVYSYPRPRDMLNRLRTLLRSYRDQGGGAPCLLFHDGDAGRALVTDAGDGLVDGLVPIEVEELGSVGPDVWLAALCYGAARVLLLDVPTVPASVREEIDGQIKVIRALLTGLGYPAPVLERIRSLPLEPSAPTQAMPPLQPTGFAGSNVKRDTLFLAIDHLAARSRGSERVLAMPEPAPFGEILVDQSACTLCMACVSVCPASALGDGADRPLLSFIERNCVQCRLCERACPESAITLNPRVLLDRQQRKAPRVLNEEPPFCCIACGAPFATRSVIERMTTKLRGHSMFSDDAALRRLQMCGDCRVKDMFAADTED